MTQFPYSKELPTECLAACFNDVTNSYKFYWFLSILEHIKKAPKGEPLIIPIKNLLADMIASVWFPTNYFRLSFGKQDRLSQIALDIKEISNLSGGAKKGEIIHEIFIQVQKKSELTEEILSVGRFVPFRFIRPFFSKELKGKSDSQVDKLIVQLAEESFFDVSHPCLYRFIDSPEKSIEIQPNWLDYLQAHIQILTGFCMWHLLTYLQKNNPNVPNIACKLFEPTQRNLKQARTFWDLVFEHLGEIRCIYSEYPMSKDNFSLDHFLPWSFVAHDLLWNIIPTPKNINSAKNDNLPDIDKYFDRFAQLQYKAFSLALDLQKTELIEDYRLLFPTQDLSESSTFPLGYFRQTLANTIVPQIQIAKNMGFSSEWSHKVS